MVGHYSYGMYPQFCGDGTNQVTPASAVERPICFLPSLSLAYAPIHLCKDREHCFNQKDIHYYRKTGSNYQLISLELCLGIDCNHMPMNQILT